MDNAPYHSIQVENQPTLAWKKQDIATWLTKRGLLFEEGSTKQELFSVAKNNKAEVKYVIDELTRSHGHEVLRLPLYHCQFNAIELVWANFKIYYNKNTGRDGYGDQKVLAMWEEALSQFSPQCWQKCVEHTE